MSKYDNLFAEKQVLDPLASPDDIRGRNTQERLLGTILNGVHEEYLPPTVAVHGPSGTGNIVMMRRVCREFADRTDDLAVEYVNLKEYRSIFSAANEIHLELTGEKVGSYEGLDDVLAGIWATLAGYRTWTVSSSTRSIRSNRARITSPPNTSTDCCAGKGTSLGISSCRRGSSRTICWRWISGWTIASIVQ